MSCQTLTDDKTPQNTATCVYKAQVGGYWRNVTVVWAKNTIINHSLDISIDSVASELHANHKIDLNPWSFWAKKGCKTIHVDGNQIELYWDFRSANYLGSPEPCSDFYLAFIYEEKVVMLIGDMKEKVYKKTQTQAAKVEGALVFKKEHVFGTKRFMTRAKLDPNMEDCEIVVESSHLESKDPEMWIRVDGNVVMHIRNLQWKFRGNQTFLINKQPFEVWWDVRTWLFSDRGSSHGLFVFKHGELQEESVRDDDGEQVGSNYRSWTNLELSLFLYAWVTE